MSIGTKREDQYIYAKGEMGDRIRSFDWTSTSLGPISSWPDSLLTIVNLILDSSFPMFIFWGSERIQFYNDAYLQILGTDPASKHPKALGQKGEDCWQEVWPVVFPLIEKVIETGKPVYLEDQLIPIYRQGRLDEVYWTFSYNPIRDKGGKPGGIFVVCSETTEKIKFQKEITDSYNKQQAMNGEIAAINEEIASSNEELMATNEELYQSQQALQGLNEELEQRVYSRTLELVAAQKEMALERDRLKGFFMQAPAGICILDGPNLVFELINEPYQQLFPERELLGKPLLEALPEIKGQPIWDILQEVYATGETYEGRELLIPLAYSEDGLTEDRYFNFIYQARRNANGEVDGLMVFVFEVTDTVRSKKRIEVSESRLATMVMTSHYPLMILSGINFQVDIANQQLANLWGKSLEDIIGNKLLDILPELEGQPFPELLRKVYETGIPFGQEEEVFFVNTPNGLLTKYISFYYDPLTDSEGRVTGVIVAASDITEMVLARKRVEESEEEAQALNEELSAANEELAATNEELTVTNEELLQAQQQMEMLNEQLEDSETLFRNVFEQAPLGMCVLKGPEYMVELANDNILKIWGRSREDVLLLPHFDARPELQGQQVHILMEEAFTTGSTKVNRELKVFLYAGEGKTREAFVNSVYQPLRDTNGKVTGLLIIIDEVTERVLERQQVDRAQQQLGLAVESAELGTWYMNPENGEIFVSARTKELFGFYPDEPFSLKAATDQIRDEHREDVINAIENAIANGSAFDIEYPVVGYHDGQLRWVKATGKLYKAQAGEPAYFSGTILDITDRKEIEQRKDDFISVASHELKTPLTSLNASMQLLTRMYRSNPSAIKIPEFLSKANTHLSRLMHLIDDLMNVSKLQHGKLPLHKTMFKLSDLINDCCDHVRADRSHEIIIEGDTALQVFADQVRINQVMVNLVNNAVKYAPESGKIEILVEKIGGTAKVSVQDFGPGIPADKLPHLFDRYYRVHESGVQFSGLGLGLYISAEIIERHDGQIGVESELGKGSTFWFTLPLL